jgi:maltose/maltodextrin transport system permease protein
MAIVTGKSERTRLFLTHLTMISLIAISLFPLLLVISISFRTGNFSTGDILPTNPSLEHWKLAFGIPYTDNQGTVREPPFPVLRWLWNSVKVASFSSLLVVLLSTTCAYAFARMKFAFKSQILTSLLVLQMFPMVLALVAIYALLDLIGTYLFPWLGLETHGGLILVYMGGISLHIWTVKGYFETIPASMEESAQMDGATPFQAFRHILLPMSYPILVVVFILSFIGTVIEYPVASIAVQKTENLTLAVGTQFYLSSQSFLWGDFAAAAVLAGIPITILFLLAQKWLVSGLTAGGVKG